MLAVSSENRCAVGAEEESVSTSADPMENSFFHEASVNHKEQEGESHTNGTFSVPSKVFPREFGRMPVSEEIDALSTYVGEKAETEDMDAKDMTSVESIDKFEENKQTEDACAKEMNAVLHTGNVEEAKMLAEDNGVKEAVDENNQGESPGSREERAVQTTVNVHEKDQTEGSSAKKMDTELNTDNADNRKTDGTSKEEMHEAQHGDNTEEKEADKTSGKEADDVHSMDNAEEQKQAEVACAKEMNAALHTDNVEEEKLAEDNGMKEAVNENNQSEATGSREARAVQSTVNVHEKGQTEGSSAKKMDTEFCTNDADNSQIDGTGEEEMYEVQHGDNTKEKEVDETSGKEADTVHSMENAKEQKQTEGTVCLEGSKQNEEIAALGSRLNSARISVPLKVLLAEASLESKEKKPSTKERVLSFTRRASLKDGNSSAKPGSAGLDDQYWNSPAKLPHDNNVDKRSRVRKQPWMPFICCHSVH